MGSCCPSSTKKYNDTTNNKDPNKPQNVENSVQVLIRAAIPETKQEFASENQTAEAIKKSPIIKSSQESRRRKRLTNSKKTTDITDSFRHRNESIEVSAVSFQDVLKANYRHQILSCSLPEIQENRPHQGIMKVKQGMGIKFNMGKEIIPSAALSGYDSEQRKMLIHYVTSLTELAVAYQQEGYFEESLDCIKSASEVYAELSMNPHLSLCLGMYFMANVTLLSTIGNN